MRGTYHITRAWLPLLITSGGDETIVSLTSLGAHMITPRISDYSVSLSQSVNVLEDDSRVLEDI